MKPSTALLLHGFLARRRSLVAAMPPDDPGAAATLLPRLRAHVAHAVRCLRAERRLGRPVSPASSSPSNN